MSGDADPASHHRPTDPATIRAAAVELAARGLTPRDIASALRLSEDAVRELLGPADHPRGENSR